MKQILNFQLKYIVFMLTACTQLAVLSGAPAFAKDATEVGSSLGGYPVCEASGAVVVPCPQWKKKTAKNCLLVADNELEDRLFLYEIGKGGTVLKKRREIGLSKMLQKLEKREIEDIEALARLPSGEIIVYGSHSRNNKCKIKKDRRIFAGGLLGKRSMKEGSIEPVGPSEKGKKHECRLLFGDEPNVEMQQVCEVILHTEKHAGKIWEKWKDSQKDLQKDVWEALWKKDCNIDPAFNLEGAVAIPNSDGGVELWVGLRSPLVEGKAVLMRQKAVREEFRFDAVVFLDLKNRGVRDLTFAKAGGKVWGIAGQESDPKKGEKPAHILWNLDPATLKHGVTIEPTIVLNDLPTFAEGLAIHDGHAFILMDGGDPKENGDPMICEAESRYIVRSIAE